MLFMLAERSQSLRTASEPGIGHRAAVRQDGGWVRVAGAAGPVELGTASGVLPSAGVSRATIQQRSDLRAAPPREAAV